MKKYFIPVVIASMLIGGTLMGMFYTDSFWFWLGVAVFGVAAGFWLTLVVFGIKNMKRNG